ncbi:MAG: hypothetical protein ABJA69_04920 [Acidobacteriaceae bacterium]
MDIVALLRIVLLAPLAVNPLPSKALQAVQSNPTTEQLQKDRKDEKDQRQHQKAAAKQDEKNKKTALQHAPQSQKLPESLKKHPNQHKAANVPATETQKTVVKQGSTPDPKAQISPRIPPAQASHEILSTAELLTSTNENLKKLSGRQLNLSQQEMLNQVHSYVQQSKSAGDSGDLQRSQNLAYKAHLLSDELTHH